MTRPLPAIQMFWHGRPLSRIEWLSMTSFLRNGHDVHLYVYDELPAVPSGVQVMDAAQILPRSSIFLHAKRRSIAHFADWFRYRLLFERGGLWSDTDMVCLAPFDFDSPIVFAWQDVHFLNNAVLGLPAGDALAKWLAESCEFPNRVQPYDDFKTRFARVKRLVKGQGREWVRWGDTGPYGLTRAARHLGYLRYALPSAQFYPVSFDDNHTLFECASSDALSRFDGCRAVHLWNQLISGVDKDGRFPVDSPFERWWARYFNAAA